MKKYLNKINISKTFVKWCLSICLLFIICMNLFSYLTKGEINIASLAAVIGLLPAALKALEYKISKQLERVITICAAIGLIYIIFWDTFF